MREPSPIWWDRAQIQKRPLQGIVPSFGLNTFFWLSRTFPFILNSPENLSIFKFLRTSPTDSSEKMVSTACTFLGVRLQSRTGFWDFSFDSLTTTLRFLWYISAHMKAHYNFIVVMNVLVPSRRVFTNLLAPLTDSVVNLYQLNWLFTNTTSKKILIKYSPQIPWLCILVVTARSGFMKFSVHHFVQVLPMVSLERLNILSWWTQKLFSK